MFVRQSPRTHAEHITIIFALRCASEERKDSIMSKTKKVTRYVAVEKATGPIRFTLMNDMMFHMVMSKSKRALKGLMCYH